MMAKADEEKRSMRRTRGSTMLLLLESGKKGLTEGRDCPSDRCGDLQGPSDLHRWPLQDLLLQFRCCYYRHIGGLAAVGDGNAILPSCVPRCEQ